LEKAVDKLALLMQQGPGLVAMTGDMVDEAVRNADARGVNVDERLKNALAIAEKLTSTEMVDKLDKLLKVADQMPGLVAMTGDIVDEAYHNADARGISIDQRLRAGLEMAEKLTDPTFMKKMDGLFNMANQMPGLIAMAVDSYDEQMKKLNENGFDPRTLMEVAGNANTALTNAMNEPPAKVGGIFGLFRVLKDPDRQKGLGFLMNFLKHFGRKI
ncbi:MAG TPA: DUF1641 domain-containing protein, partial [Bacteroidetes bacterium]|nr:DUF1641 domain-containing protein [Bacteroidota bacterium]